MRIYISADMEGIAGVTAINHLIPGEFEYDRAREWMTGEVRAACEAALAAGAEEVVVSDSHGNGQSLLVEKLPQEKVTLVRSWPRPMFMMQGIEDGHFDGAMFIGYHLGSRQYPGAIAHTVAGDVIEIRINGKVMSETMICAETAACYGVPVVMVSGDAGYVAHAQKVLGDVECAAVKESYTGRSVKTLLPAAAEKLVAEKVAAALARINDFHSPDPTGPYEVEFFVSNLLKVDWLEFLPGFERVDSHTVRASAENAVALNKLIGFVGFYQPRAV
ncbi:M55 family metallopeptidase [Emcibacter nanhaiensis]|uniref:M55 family metallopeptidase n=1 Tax=Emcibacter nanhaiensis TaxID=1505037 RepID=A0A501PGT6_9PROT|nr:M55 family metallopeptidase [Emcibacter nanhaiensis]TPD59287.1 hypothetical protein FIV46_10850 [Emcibacter nanhaiensis]